MSAPLTQAYVALGSNLGDSHAHLDAAIAALAARDDIESVQESPRYRSAPMGPQDQPDYLNSVCGLRTSLSALSLLTVLQDIERQRGRQRPTDAVEIAALRWQARSLDLDLLLFGAEQINDARLTVPHPRMGERSFVLQPLYDIAPHIEVPRAGTVAALLRTLPPQGIHREDPGS